MLWRKDGILLSDCTTFRIGGPALVWLEPDSPSDILDAIDMAQRHRNFVLIGNGSNILARDEGFDGAVVKLGRGFDYIEDVGDGLVRVGAATSINRFISRCIELELSGCEFLSGIPGSIGGAVFMNAGVRDLDDQKIFNEIKDRIFEIEILDIDDKIIRILKREDVDFSYRSSGLEGKWILSALIKLEKDVSSRIKSRVQSFLKKREWISKISFPTAGSIFKNPSEGNPAGRLIEMCGLKGKRIGGAEISKLHANFIVNRCKARAADVLALIELAQDAVRERFNIELELEIKII